MGGALGEVVSATAWHESLSLQIFWVKLEDHTVGFRQGPLSAQWRAIIGPYFAHPPAVEHFELVGKSGSSAT